MHSQSGKNDTSCTRQVQFSRLLDLPTEVRAIILRELLCLPTPLGYHEGRAGILEKQSRNFELCPQILRVCKQLHKEGQPLLGTNTLGLDVWIDIYDGTPAMWSFVGCEPASHDGLPWGDSFWPRDNVAKLWKESLTLHMAVHFLKPTNIDEEEEEEEEEEEDNHYIRKGLEVIDRLLFTKQNLGVCKLTFEILGLDENYEPDRESTIGVLEPLSLLRCKEAQIIGVSACYAAKVTSKMTLTTPSTNLYAMKDALEKYARIYYYSPEEESHGFDNMPFTWKDVVESVSAADVERFKTVRKTVMEDIEALRKEMQAEVYERDS